jgi:hypothetical protein
MGVPHLMRAIKRLSGAASMVVVGLLAIVGGLYLYVQASCNLHAVEDGKVYRSGQMPAEQLERFVKQAGIRSVINLRGENIGQGWYDQESRSTRLLGVSLINYPISARSELSVEQMRKISALIRDAEKPVLIHCAGGADRTGLASALHCVDSGLPVQDALAQLSPYYGHFPYLLWADASAMDASLDRYLKVARVPVAGEVR